MVKTKHGKGKTYKNSLKNSRATAFTLGYRREGKEPISKNLTEK
jgi:hypothetical protein